MNNNVQALLNKRISFTEKKLLLMLKQNINRIETKNIEEVILYLYVFFLFIQVKRISFLNRIERFSHTVREILYPHKMLFLSRIPILY